MKWFLRIVNIAICAMAVLCITMFATTSAVDFKIKYEVDNTELKQYVSKSEFNEIEVDGKKVKLSDMISDEKVTIPLAVDLTLKDLVEISTKDENKVQEFVTKEIIEDLIKGVMEDESMVKLINSIAEKIAKVAAKVALKTAIFENMTDPNEKTDEYLNSVGLNDEYVDTKVEDVFNALKEEGASVESVTSVIIDVANDAIAKMNEAREGADIPEITPEQQADLEKQIEQKMSEVGLVDSDGNLLPVDEAILSFIAGILPDVPAEDGGEGESSSIVLHHYASTGDDAKKQQATKEIAEKLAALINKSLTDVLQVKYVIIISRVALGVIIASMAMWAGLLIFALFKTFSKKKPYIYMGPFFWITFVAFTLVQLVLGGLPVILTNFLPAVTKVLPEQAASVMTHLELNLRSSFTTSLICAAVLICVGIVYAIVGHKVKKQYKAAKKAAKVAA